MINLYKKKVLWICPIPKSSCMIFLKRLTASQKRITFCMCTSEYYEFSFCWNEKKSARAILHIGILLNKNTTIKLFCTRFTLIPIHYIIFHFEGFGYKCLYKNTSLSKSCHKSHSVS